MRVCAHVRVHVCVRGNGGGGLEQLYKNREGIKFNFYLISKTFFKAPPYIFDLVIPFLRK